MAELLHILASKAVSQTFHLLYQSHIFKKSVTISVLLNFVLYLIIPKWFKEKKRFKSFECMGFKSILKQFESVFVLLHSQI